MVDMVSDGMDPIMPHELMAVGRFLNQTIPQRIATDRGPVVRPDPAENGRAGYRRISRMSITGMAKLGRSLNTV